MTEDRQKQVTTLLRDIQAGDADAESKLVDLVYQELCETASRLLKEERPNHTWQTGDLVHETFLHLKEQEFMQRAENRRHFFAAASNAMRQLLVDQARRRQAKKRGGDRAVHVLDSTIDYLESRNVNLLDLDDALDKLAQLNRRQSQVVEMRFYAGLPVKSVAETLQISVSTVESDYRKARIYLRLQLDDQID